MCFGTGARLCQKAGHSCFRKIVSYVSFPARRRWRFIHCALEAVVRFTGMGDEVWSLRDACVVMKERLVPTNACAQDVCARCNSRKHRLVALTADAGQFYEVV